MKDLIAKMTASVGLPLRVFCTSESINKLFKKSGYDKLPRSSNTIKIIVVRKSDELKAALNIELKMLKNEGQKLAVSLDEWTSIRNRRYMNVNVYSPNLSDKCFRNLGLTRIISSGTADHCADILRAKLQDYDINTEQDIACVVTDGASVMCAMGRKLPTYHQLCLAHGIQCAVVDVIYKKDYSETNETQLVDNITTVSAESGSDTEAEEEEEDGLIIEYRLDRNQRTPSLVYYKDLVDKVRKAVKLFIKSPTKGTILQTYVTDENKELKLILDCKTRWNSMADMISRFLLLIDAVLKALIDVKSEITFCASVISLMDEFSTSLNVIKATVEAICQEKASLLTAETALKFMIAKLENIKSFISERLLEALKYRILQRRRTELVFTLKYLHNPKAFYNETPSPIFTTSSNALITETIIDINKKYFCNQSEDDENDEDDIPLIRLRNQEVDGQIREAEAGISLKDQLQKQINDTIMTTSSTSTANLTDRDDLGTSIRVQMALYDRAAPKQVYLEQAYNFLLSIPPTSVECERVFSSSKYICSHLRSSLKDDTLDTLSFLRSHYQLKNSNYVFLNLLVIRTKN